LHLLALKQLAAIQQRGRGPVALLVFRALVWLQLQPDCELLPTRIATGQLKNLE
jgi:hypothetical protein